jgi:chemotaxis protein CheX
MTHETAALPQSTRLPETLNLSAAAPLARALLEQRGRDVVIDASQVQHLGAQCLQVLLSAASTWRAEKASLRIADRSAGFARGLEVFGIPATTFPE